MEKDSIILSVDIFKKFAHVIHKLTGISLNESKLTMVQLRLRKRIVELRQNSFSDYLSYLNSHQDEEQTFINLVTTNETYFFRTNRVWDYFEKEYLPSWFAKHPKQTLKIWSAAASTGEEAYSLAICCEEFKLRHASFNYQIIGTDISSKVLVKAREGIYQPRSIENFKNIKSSIFSKYISLGANEVSVNNILKKNINFQLHNLFKTPQRLEYFDIVFLRNVLIYFNREDQERVLENVSKSLVGDGELIIGESESLNNLRTPFLFKSPLVYSKGEASHVRKSA